MPGCKRYNTYDDFAWYYVRGWAAEYHDQVRHLLDGGDLALLPPAARVLDLCCGAGDLSRSLVARGFRVTGIDGSARMLAFARRRVPKAKFLLRDARSFRLGSRVHAAISTFDSLNHILTIEELESVFYNVHAALTPGGLFVFDMNMLECFHTLWQGTFSTVDAATASITRGSYSPSECLGRAEVTLFRKRGVTWERTDVVVQERCYAPDEVMAALARAGFRKMWTREAEDVGMQGMVAVGRTFFFATT